MAAEGEGAYLLFMGMTVVGRVTLATAELTFTHSVLSLRIVRPNDGRLLSVVAMNRILGGIPTILPWWPIKPYRPCPNFIERGGRYVRSGQALDEIAFGRDSTYKPDGN
jgi:hypothetical protein